jgi:hypothetical protein
MATVSGDGSLRVAVGDLVVYQPADGQKPLRVPFVTGDSVTTLQLQAGLTGELLVEALSVRESARLQVLGHAIPVSMDDEI